MGDELFDYDGWDAVEAMLREHEASIAKAHLVEKVQSPDGTREEQVDVFDFDDEDERRVVLTEQRDREAGDGIRDGFDEDPWSGNDDDEDDDRPEDDAGKPPKEKQSPEERLREGLVIRCLARLRRAAQENIVGERQKVYLVRCMAPKGKALGKKQFTLRNLGPVNEEERVPGGMTRASGKDGTPVYDAPIGLASVRAYTALAHQYERLGNMALSQAERAVRLEASTNSRLHAQVNDLMKQVDQLLAANITLKGMASEEDKEALRQLSSGDRTKLATNAMDKFSELGKAFFMSRGLSEHAIKIVNLLGAHAKVKELLDRQDVVAVLSDPAELDDFANGLYQIVDMSARAYAAKKAAADQSKKPEQGASAQ